MRTQQHPIIVLDGPDGAGKTTLANEIARQSGGRVIHLTYRFKDKMPSYHTAALELALRYSEHQTVVLDRWWPSQTCYASAYRGGSEWPMMDRLLDRVALKHRLIYCICLPQDKNRLVAEFNHLKGQREEMYDEGMDRVYDAYDQLWWTYFANRHDAVRYDRFEAERKETLEAEAWLLIDSANRRLRATWTEALNIEQRNVAGNLYTPKVVLVGERSNPKSRRNVWPFFEHANSSLWLAEALTHAGIREFDLAWANAQSYEDGASNAGLVKTIADSTGAVIVPMGMPALRMVERELGIQCELALKHPQHSRRFSPTDFSGYSRLAELIKELKQ